MKRWLAALIALVCAFTLSSPAQALTYTWSDINTVAATDGVSGHVATGDDFAALWQPQLVALENGKIFAFWIVSTNGVSGFAKPSTSKLYSSTYIPGIGWGAATQRYSSNTRISDLSALKIGTNAIGIVFQEETYGAGATEPSQVKVRLTSVSSPTNPGSSDTWRTVSTLTDTNNFSRIRFVTGNAGFMTVVVDSSATLNGVVTTFANRFEAASQVLTELPVPTGPAGALLSDMRQLHSGYFVWFFETNSGDVYLQSTRMVGSVAQESTATRLNLNSSITEFNFALAPDLEEQSGGVVYFTDSNGVSWMFIVTAQGGLQSPHRIASTGRPMKAGIDGLGYFYVAMDVTNQDSSHSFSLAVMNLSDYSVRTVELAANSNPEFVTNLSGNVLYTSVSQSALTSGQLRGGQWVGAITTYNWNLTAVPEFISAGGVTEFAMLWATQDLGVRSVVSETDQPDPVTGITGNWTAPDAAVFSWTAPTNDPDYLYNWSADCGTFGQQQGESRDKFIAIEDISALIGCNIYVKALQGGLESSVAQWRLSPQTVAKVSQLRTRWVGPSSAEVKWTASATPAATYSVKVTANNFTRVVTSPATSVVVAGLNPAKVYRVEVTALKFTAKSTMVAGGIAVAKKASAPRDVKFSGTGTAIKLVWNAPKTNASFVYGYRVSFKVGSGKWTKLGDVAVRSISLNRTFGTKKSVQFKVEALTGYTSPAALSKARTSLANGRL